MPFHRRTFSSKSPQLPFARRTPPQASGPLPTETSVSGEVQRIVFANPDNGYVVLKLKRDGGKGEAVLAGSLSGVQPGVCIEVTGHWTDHPQFGRQFQVEQCHLQLPTTTSGIAKFLASSVPGISTKLANDIVKHFGDQTLEILEKESWRLREVHGIGSGKLKQLVEAWQKSADTREAQIFLQGIGLTPNLAEKVIQKFGARSAPEIVRKNPYRLATEIEGVGFLTADRFALSQNIAPDSPFRCGAALVYALDQAQQDGQVCLPQSRLFLEAENLVAQPVEALQNGYDEALRNGLLREEKAHPEIADDPLCYLPQLYYAEIQLSEILNILLKAPKTPSPPQSLPGFSGNLRLNAEQLQAVQCALSAPVSILTGGPGVGKTTTVAAMVKAALLRGWTVKLAAPTGRAARRLSEATGQSATTIHRLLQYNPKLKGFSFNPESPLPCKFLILDEVSMLDVPLARSLFRAVRPGTHVVLVGDKDQLPSVGPGAVLHDLISCGRIPVTELKQIYRQSAGSRIITSAHEVNRGIVPQLVNPPKGTRGDFYFYSCDDPQRTSEFIASLVSRSIPQFFGFNSLEDIQVLTPMRKGECGTTALNQALQEALNPPSPDKPELTLNSDPPRIFRLGDRVMQTKNNYEKQVFNGEMGRIIEVNPSTKSFQVLFDQAKVDYQSGDCGQLLHAYAITIHKSQGSEFPCVVMPLLPQHYMMLQRNLLYTGMTRAKKLFILLGNEYSVKTAVRNDTPMQRYSLLGWRLSGTCPPRL